MPAKSRSKNKNIRIYCLLGSIFLLFSLIVWRLFFIQIKEHDFYKALANDQGRSFDSRISYRGEIKTIDNYTLAVNKKWPMVYAVPKKVINPEETAKQLAELLEMDEETIFKRLDKLNDPYEPLKQKISDETSSKIQELNLNGIAIDYQWTRYYPGQNMAAQLIGFVSQEGGQYGLEKYYEENLAQGEDLVLTIDYTIQFFVEQKIKELREAFNAKAGSAIIMDPKTGAIIALVNYPDFNPNSYSDTENINLFLNPAVNYIFEPGSVFKPITMASALDSKKITPQTTYYDAGEKVIGNYTIHNWDGQAYGRQTMTQVLEKSLNTGAIFAGEQAGKEIFLQYVRDFGFGLPTGIGLPGESKGDISNLSIKSDINYATASYGQGISVTPLQLITALSAIANNGKLMQPYIIASQKPQIIRQVISPQTSWQLTEMLKSVFKSGNLQNFQVQGYEIAGKTGTAQVPEKGGYSQDKSIHTLVGYAPADNPAFIVLLKLDEPIGARWSAVSLPPTFHEILKFLLNYYQIPPSK
ncbi:MAG: penicillin-binding protein 2 [bacterium]